MVERGGGAGLEACALQEVVGGALCKRRSERVWSEIIVEAMASCRCCFCCWWDETALR